MAPNLQSKGIQFSATIAQDFDINYALILKEFSTEFATAYSASSKNGDGLAYYALIFNKSFPADLDKISSYKNINARNVQKLADFGRVQTNAGEALCCILRRPVGVRLSDLAGRGGIEENFVTTYLAAQLFNAVLEIHESGIMHGGINLENIFFDQASGVVTLLEPVSEFVGYSQKPVYETLDRMVCHKAGKTPREKPADYYACGMTIAGLLSGGEILKTLDDEGVRKSKFINGSFETAMGIVGPKPPTLIVTPKTETLLRGLLHDKTKERWGDKQIAGWQKKEFTQPPPSRVHRQAISSLRFNDIDFYGLKYLAHELHINWQQARKNLELDDLTRWISFTSRQPDTDKRMQMMSQIEHSEIVIPDEKLARIIYLIDNDGPMRYKNISFHPDAMGSFFAYLFSSKNVNLLKELYELIDASLMDGWISAQEFPDNYKPNQMGWAPRKIRLFLKRDEIGFGPERCLYELNPYLPCLSPILDGVYAVGLPTILTALNQGRLTGKNIDDDRHLTAYIFFQAGIDEPLRVKHLQSFGEIARSIPIKLAAMFAIAQKRSGLGSLNGIASWLRQQLNSVTEKMNSSNLRRKTLEDLDAATATGDIQKIFATITDARMLKKDIYGFHEAKRQFKILSFEILKLQSQHNLDQLAYRMGLKVAVVFSYLICAVAILSVVFMNF